MASRSLVLGCVLFLIAPVFFLRATSMMEVRTAEVMIKAGEYARRGSWFGLVKQARKLYLWGETRYVEKCLELAGRLVVAKRSEAGATHVADLYGKVNKPRKKKYWMDFLRHLRKLKAMRWKKS